MSFVERNKAWILPALAVGAAAVVYLNVRTLSAPTPSTPLPSAAHSAEPPPPSAAPAAVPGADAHLWDDLLPLAVVPAGLEGRETFERRALTTLGAADLIGSAPPAGLARPDSEPGRPVPVAPSGGAAPATPAPHPDFLIQGPAGARAWFEGRGYRPGQTLQGQPFQVQGVELDPAPRVHLKGAGGLATRSTRLPAPPPKELP